MKKFTKILAVVLALALTAALSVGLTLAYLTDQDEAVNVMTLGNVQIDQIEQEWNADQTQLVDFTQAKPLYPYVGELGWKNADNYAYRQFTMNNVVDKYVTVKNTGKSDAYVRTLIAFELGEMTAAEWEEMIGVALNSVTSTAADFTGTWAWGPFDAAAPVINVDGHNYLLYVATHQNPVKPGETTIPSLMQVYLSKDATNEVVEKLDGNNNGTYDILVKSQAVQTAGFDDAKTALDVAFGKTADKAAEWFGGVHIPDLSNSTVVSSVDELATALAAGENVVLSNDVTVSEDTSIPVQGDVVIDLAGNTLTMTAGDNAAAAKAISVFTVANGQTLTIEGGEFVANFGANGTDYASGNKPNNMFSVQKGGKLVINDGTFKATKPDGVYNLIPVIIDNNGEVEINGGSFSASTINMFRNTNGKMTINGGTFTGVTNPNGSKNYPYTVIWNQYANAELIVNGGTFTNMEIEKEAGTATVASGINLPLWKPASER